MTNVMVETVHGFQVRATVGGHRTVLDEKTEVGGTDRGPAPTEMFLVSLASCASITMTMYARRKGWGLEGSKVKVTLEPATAGAPAKVVQEIELLGKLDAEQKERLREIAGKCPVHKLAVGPTTYEERLA